MNALTEKVLKSGLIDKSVAELMERQGILPEGSAEKVDENALKDATREKLIAITESLAVEVEREQRIKETYLDLERLRWPVRIFIATPDLPNQQHTSWLDAVIDRQGRYYFRSQDVDVTKLVPGYLLVRDGKKTKETILEVQPLFIEDSVVAIQVTTREE
jgi:hypothetical protein